MDLLFEGSLAHDNKLNVFKTVYRAYTKQFQMVDLIKKEK